MNTLVLITDTFPYGEISEAFLENEMPYIGEFFEKVIFCPLGRNGKVRQLQTLKIPYEVIPPHEFHVLTKFEILNFSLKNLFKKYFLRDVLEETQSRKRVLKESWIPCFKESLKSVLKAHQKAQYYQKGLQFKITKRDNPLFYSYWFHEGAYLAGLLKNEFKGKAISRAHGYDCFHFRSGYAPFHHPAGRLINKVYPCSNAGLLYLQKDIPKYTAKIETQYLGTNDYGLQPYSQEKTFQLISCSFVVPVKRIERIIDALALITEFPIQWVHLGEKRDPQLWDSLHNRAKKKLPSSVSFEFKGAMTNQEVLNYHLENSSDLFVNVSESEGLPVSIMEALSFGIPVAATAVGGTPEIVQKNNGGFLLSEEYPEKELPEVIRKLRSMPQEEYLNLRCRGREFWEKKFSARKNYSDFLKDINKGLQ